MSAQRLDIDAVLADPLATARHADRAIGYVGLDIPEDILAAPGHVAVHLPWDRTSCTPWADRWLEDSFPGWARCILEGWSAGMFDSFAAVVFSRGDDVSQRLYYYVCELQRQARIGGPTALVFDVARIPRLSSAEHTEQAVRRLAKELGLADEELSAGIRTADRRRQLLQAMDRERTLPGHRLEQLARASLFAPPEAFDIRHEEELPEAKGRVLLAGSVPPDDGLHRAVEAAGWSVAGEAHARNLLRLGPPIGFPAAEPVRQIARHAFAHPVGPRGFNTRASMIVAQAKARNADAVILWGFEEDEAFAWDVVTVRRALDAASLPGLVLARRRWDLSDAPDKDIRRFLAETTCSL